MTLSPAKYFSFNTKAISYSVRIFLGAIIVWWSLYYLHDNKKVWALISIIVVSDPDFVTLRSSIVSRTINTITGCILGLAFIFLLGVNIWSLMSAITLSVIFSTSFVHYPTSWKLAPSTVVVVMAPSIVESIPRNEALIVALTRTGEVLYGCLVAFLLGVLFKEIEKRYHLKFSTKQGGEY